MHKERPTRQVRPNPEGTYLTGCVEDFKHARHSLVINNLLISVFDGGVILNTQQHNKKASERAEGVECVSVWRRGPFDGDGADLQGY